MTTSPIRRQIVVITGDPVGTKMAGPAIRAWKMAAALSNEHDVRLISLTAADQDGASFATYVVPPGDDRLFRRHEQWADIIIFQGHALEYFRSLRRSRKYVVADAYAPLYLERLEQSRDSSKRRWNAEVNYGTASINEQLAGCDLILCASERQRYLYLGQMAALGRINAHTYEDDPRLSKLVAVVPFGLDQETPRHTRPALRGVRDPIGAKDKVILWSGGLYNWFDPETLITAVASLAKRHENVRLFFMGTKHPNPGVPEMDVVTTARALARKLDVYGTHVLFNDAWVDFDDRHNYLLEADVGVSTHYEHVETTFSFRTRILDYLWAGLPIVSTQGDVFGELIERKGLGVTVPESDAQALEAALEKALFDKEFVENSKLAVQRERGEYTWNVVLEPLLAFARDPHQSPDRRGRGRSLRLASVPRLHYGIGRDFRRTWTHLRSHGIRAVLRKGWQAARRRSGLSRPPESNNE